MNLGLALAGVGLLLASSVLFAAGGAPQSVPVALTAAAVTGATAALARFGRGRDAA
jgi:CHASE2 domain-containing sensor protein